jgi:hypothetical protein
MAAMVEHNKTTPVSGNKTAIGWILRQRQQQQCGNQYKS